MYDNTPNDILYVESGRYPLLSAIMSRQYKFWNGIHKDTITHPDSPITRLVQLAIRHNIPFITHYQKLYTDHTSHAHVTTIINDTFSGKLHDNLNTYHTLDPHGKLGTYSPSILITS